MNVNFEYMTDLQYQVKSLKSQVQAFKSGEKYVTMRQEFSKRLAIKERKINQLKLELGDSRCETITIRKNWMQVFEDIISEHEKEIREKIRVIEELREELLVTFKKLDEVQDNLSSKTKKLYEIETELEEEKGKNLKLRAQINRDYENSSTPSSLKPNHKKITNSREKTGRKPGGQPGHEGHVRKKHTPSQVIHIPAPEKYTANPDYKLTGKIIKKQMVNLKVILDVAEYDTPEFRNIHTGQRVHADFPPALIDEVNYGGSIKAFAFLMNSHCCVSIDKVREFLSELTDGKLQISKGMISGLCQKFSEKTEAEQRKAFTDLLLSPVMNTDFTNARANGKNAQIAVCTTPAVTLYFAKEHKGHKGIEGTPVEDYQGILVHDHDKTFYNYGSGHQECLSHTNRYLKNSMENEPNLKWSSEMKNLIQEMIHYRNGLTEDEDTDPAKVKEYENRYLEILDTARKEYEYEPPNDYYKEGFNLYKRMKEYMENHLLFLHDKRVPATNNAAERKARNYKRKQKQVMGFRSFESLHYICSCLSMIDLLRTKEVNLFKSVTSIFD